MVTITTAPTELIDTGETRDQRGRKLTPRPRRAELVAAWRQSGLTQAEFARREGVRYPTFASWVQQARLAAGGPGRSPGLAVRFAEVQVPTSAVACAAVPPTPPPPAAACGSAVEVRLPDGTVVRGAHAADVAAVARALRA